MERIGKSIEESPRWMLLGGFCLAFMASAVNVDFMLSVGLSVSHLTGDVARITADLLVHSEGFSNSAYLLSLAVGGFVSGAFASGFIIHHPRFSITRPYGRSVLTIGMALIGASLLRNRFPGAASFLAAGACGFQNALATHYKGLILRTTHITGIITDFGQMLGMKACGQKVDAWKILVQGMIIFSFTLGALGGAWLHLRNPSWSLTVMGFLYMGGGISWTIMKRFHLKKRRKSS